MSATVSAKRTCKVPDQMSTIRGPRRDVRVSPNDSFIGKLAFCSAVVAEITKVHP